MPWPRFRFEFNVVLSKRILASTFDSWVYLSLEKSNISEKFHPIEFLRKLRERKLILNNFIEPEKFKPQTMNDAKFADGAREYGESCIKIFMEKMRNQKRDSPFLVAPVVTDLEPAGLLIVAASCSSSRCRCSCSSLLLAKSSGSSSSSSSSSSGSSSSSTSSSSSSSRTSPRLNWKREEGEKDYDHVMGHDLGDIISLG